MKGQRLLIICILWATIFACEATIHLSSINVQALPYTQDELSQHSSLAYIKKEIDPETDFITFFEPLEVTEDFYSQRDLIIQAPSIRCESLKLPHRKIVFLSTDGDVALGHHVRVRELGVQAHHVHLGSTVQVHAQTLALNGVDSVKISRGAHLIIKDNYHVQTRQLFDESTTLSPEDTMIVADEVEYGSQLNWSTWSAQIFAKQRLVLQPGAVVCIGHRLQIVNKRSIYLRGCIQQPKTTQDYLTAIRTQHPQQSLVVPTKPIQREHRGVSIQSEGLIECAPIAVPLKKVI